MAKKTNPKLLILITGLLSASSCGSPNSAAPPPPGVVHQKAPQGIDISASDVASGGCLNLQLLLERINAFPPDTRGEIHSTDIQIHAPSDARPAFAQLLARSAFEVDEGALRDLTQADVPMHFANAKQSDCASVQLYNDHQDADVYLITKSAASSLSLVSVPPGTTVDIAMQGTNSVSLHVTYTAIDPCVPGTQAAVDTRQSLSWRAENEPPGDSETVSLPMLQLLGNSGLTLPDDLASLPSDATDDATAVVSTTDLQLLHDAAIPPSLQICPDAVPSASSGSSTSATLR